MKKPGSLRVPILVVAAGLLAAACGGRSSVSPTPVSPTPNPTPEPAAQYRVTFRSTWSAASHPTDFPSNPHFSPLVGGTHAGRVRFWAEGETASNGIEAMAERGDPEPLAREVDAAVAAGTAQHVLRGGGISRSPGEVSLDFEIGRDFPLVTLVSMVAPSPDWFVGVHDLDMLAGGAWVRDLTVTLYIHDAGTDSGTTYTSPDADTQPRGRIQRLEGYPVAVGDRVAPGGTFRFERVR